ncbi:MAG: glycyl-radical enzyme activating protein [Deltaproteobacteria bacterium]|nr:glycyl-radical enzyme activating protein [Deltaproteobacteria bacterium]
MDSSSTAAATAAASAPLLRNLSVTGTTFNIQQFSTEDGPGIRTTVFLKGCPLRCAWCHNPEGMRVAPDLMWYDVRCIAARECLSICPEQALALSQSGMQIDRARCTLCGKCVRACPSAAFELIGKQWTAEELLDELLKDQVFYETSGGGVTFSGGEPLTQIDFLSEVLPLCKAAGLQVALDTCGAVASDRLRRVLPWIDLVLYDLKVMDAAASKAATGVSNELILDNARLLAEHGTPLWIRTPLVPGYTANADNIRAIADFIRNCLPSVQRWDLLAYTNLGRPKYHRLDRPYALEDAALLTRGDMEALWRVAVELVPQAQWSGATC